MIKGSTQEDSKAWVRELNQLLSRHHFAPSLYAPFRIFHAPLLAASKVSQAIHSAEDERVLFMVPMCSISQMENATNQESGADFDTSVAIFKFAEDRKCFKCGQRSTYVLNRNSR